MSTTTRTRNSGLVGWSAGLLSLAGDCASAAVQLMEAPIAAMSQSVKGFERVVILHSWSKMRIIADSPGRCAVRIRGGGETRIMVLGPGPSHNKILAGAELFERGGANR